MKKVLGNLVKTRRARDNPRWMVVFDDWQHLVRVAIAGGLLDIDQRKGTAESESVVSVFSLIEVLASGKSMRSLATIQVSALLQMSKRGICKNAGTCKFSFIVYVV